jgi:hypothetical protein
MSIPLLRWLAVPLVIVGSIPLGIVFLAMGITSIRFPISKWIPFLEACFLTGLVSVLGAGLAAPRFKTAVKLLAIAAPLTYWLVEARLDMLIATRLEVFIVIVGIVGGGLVAWYMLERMGGTDGA